MKYLAIDLGMGAEVTSLVVIEAKTWPFLGMRRFETDTASGTEPVFLGPGKKLAKECPPPVYHLRHVERMPVGASYPRIVERAKELSGTLTEILDESVREPIVAVDATGVGHAATELFTKMQLDPFFVTITAGDEVARDGMRYRVPKRELLSTAQVLLQTERLKIARELPHAELVLKELQTFRMNLDLRKADETLSWRERPNDDLVLALATGLWIATKHDGIPGGIVVVKRIRRPYGMF